MKAGIGILLVFTGLTLGYLVLAGKLPMSSGSTASNPPFTPGQGEVPPNSQTHPIPPPIGISIVPHTGGGLVASVPDTYVQGQIKAGRYAL